MKKKTRINQQKKKRRTSQATAQKRKKKTARKPISLMGLGAGGLVLVLLLSLGSRILPTRFDTGLAYLKGQSELDIEAVQERFRQARKEEIKTQIEDENLDISTFFRDSVLMGDSRVYDFKGYGYLPENRVLAELGYTVYNIDDYLENVESLQPENIFIAYGINDLESRIGMNLGENGYRQIFEEQVDLLLERSPGSEIFINSILPVAPGAMVEELNMIDDYNRQIREMCQANGWNYIDNSNMTWQALDPYYETDGIHFRADFLPVWARQMALAAIEV